MLEAILWDNDGVLVDTERLYFESTSTVLHETGVELTEELFKTISLKEGRSCFDLAAEQGIPAEEISLLRQRRNLLYRDLLRSGVQPIDGVERTLRMLRGRLAMGVVTSSRREHFDIIHASTDLLPYFDFVLTRENYEHSKPSPDPFLTAIGMNGFEKEHCIVVEDSERGLKAAIAAGIRCIIIPNRLTREGNFSGAYGVYGTILDASEELIRLLHSDL
ncbi:MAG TPA: HAD family phosphatase [Syntrophales bacterium]|nr:HAD family phosphatase [Syntrophales bacterium]HPQ44543.1 HAD family phosphatase [Syntrophales bacterium]